MERGFDAEKFEAEFFEFVRKREEAILEAGRSWARAVGDAVPVEMPVMREVVRGAFEFTEKVLEAQREFTELFMTEMRKGLERFAETGPRTPRRAAAKRPAAHRTTVRKTTRAA